MPKKRKLAKPITQAKSTAIPGRGQFKHQRVIVAYHVLMKEREKARLDASLTAGAIWRGGKCRG